MHGMFQTKTNWFLTVHYKNFPEGEIVKFSCRDAVESFILSGIKEADALKHKVRMISDMPKNDIKKLLQVHYVLTLFESYLLSGCLLRENGCIVKRNEL